MMNRLNLFVLAVGVALLPILSARAETPPAKIEPHAGDVKELARILGVVQLGASIELPEPAYQAWVRLDFYKNGKKLRATDLLAGLGSAKPQTSYTVSVNIVDTDNLPLGGAPKNSQRMFVQIADGSEFLSISSTHKDVPKTDFGADSGTAYGILAAGASSPSQHGPDDSYREIPIAQYIRGKNTSSYGDPAITVAKNPESDVMIVVFVYSPNALGETTVRDEAR